MTRVPHALVYMLSMSVLVLQQHNCGVVTQQASKPKIFTVFPSTEKALSPLSLRLVNRDGTKRNTEITYWYGWVRKEMISKKWEVSMRHPGQGAQRGAQAPTVPCLVLFFRVTAWRGSYLLFIIQI